MSIFGSRGCVVHSEHDLTEKSARTIECHWCVPSQGFEPPKSTIDGGLTRYVSELGQEVSDDKPVSDGEVKMKIVRSIWHGERAMIQLTSGKRFGRAP